HNTANVTGDTLFSGINPCYWCARTLHVTVDIFRWRSWGCGDVTNVTAFVVLLCCGTCSGMRTLRSMRAVEKDYAVVGQSARGAGREDRRGFQPRNRRPWTFNRRRANALPSYDMFRSIVPL